MLENYNNLLKELKEEHLRDLKNAGSRKEKILLVDGLNLFIRGYTANPVVNEDGIHIGGIVGSLISLGYAIKNYKPDRVVITYDGAGGSSYRKKIFPEYKENRKNKNGKKRKYNRKFDYGDDGELEEKIMKFQLTRLMEYFACLPVTIIKEIKYVEADDIIAYIIESNPDKTFIVMSSDKDFLQLCSENVQVYSPTKKILYNENKVKDLFSVSPKNLALFRAMDGDSSDGIPGIPSWGKTRILKNVQCLKNSNHIYSIDDIFDYAKENKIEKLIENKDLVIRNYKLMQLKSVNISDSIKKKIDEKFNKTELQRLVKYIFQRMVLEDKLFTAIRNSTVWLSTVFHQLDTNAKRYNSSKNKKIKRGE